MKYIFILLTTLLTYTAKAQNIQFITQDGNTLSFASIKVEQNSTSLSTDAEGIAHFDFTKGSQLQISIRHTNINDTSFTITPENRKIILPLKTSLQEYDEVVVSATLKPMDKKDSPVNIEVYNSEYFDANPTPSLFESMQNVNGVRPQLNCNVCNTGDIHINGLEGPYTMILIDGMPIVSGLSTVYGLSGIPQSMIERVEIIKGPASTLYGSEAVGGLINVITKDPKFANKLSVNTMLSSWGELNSDLSTKYNLGKNSSALLGLNLFHYGNPIDNNKDGFTDVTLSTRLSVFNTINLTSKEGKFNSLAVRYVHENRWGGEMNWTENNRGKEDVYGESIYTDRWELFSKHQIDDKNLWNLQFSANGHYQDSYYGTTKFKAQQHVLFGQLTYANTLGKRHEILTGTALRYTHYNDNTTATEQAQLLHTYLPGVFVQDNFKINKQNTLLLGARYDYNSHHGNIISPRLNYKWNTKNKNSIIRLGLGNGYRVANVFTEDHAALTGARTVEFTDKLAPETSYNANINLEQNIHSFKKALVILDASLFYTYFTNRIIADYESDPNKIIYNNLDGFAVSKGISFNTQVHFLNGIKLRLGANIQDVSYTENKLQKQQILTEKYSSTWSVNLPIHKIHLNIDYTGNLYGPMRLPLVSEFDSRPEYSPWWSLQNIKIEYTKFKNLEIYGGVKNLLNFTPPANSIARAHDPFDQNVSFDANGNALSTPNNPEALTFDPSYIYAPNQGIRFFLGIKWTIR